MSLHSLQLFCLGWIVLALATFIFLIFVPAPYGRHIRQGWGPTISNQVGWILMELTSLGIMSYFAFSFSHPTQTFILFCFWIIHYINRTFIYPFRIKTKGKKIPWAIVGSAVFFNVINAGTNGYFLTHYHVPLNHSSLEFILGFILWIVGFLINLKSDNILIQLRNGENSSYQIPKDFLFRWISCPNHLGEMIEWLGFAVMAWNLPAFAFFIWTTANLAPRSLRHHNWYQKQFTEYPKKRKALIPYII